jgi:hypothetical protein
MISFFASLLLLWWLNFSFFCVGALRYANVLSESMLFLT